MPDTDTLQPEPDPINPEVDPAGLIDIDERIRGDEDVPSGDVPIPGGVLP